MTLGNRRACALAFVTAFAALFLQVLVHRIISAKLLNDYAFLVISLTMLGFAAAGAVLVFLQRLVLTRLPSALTFVAALYCVTALVAAVAFYRTETWASFALTRPGFVRAFFDWMPFALLFAVPFGCIAFMLGALLAARELDTRRVYFFDLLGSALGAVLVIPGIRYLGVETDLLLIAGFLPVAALALLPAATRAARAACLVSLVAVALVASNRGALLDLKPPLGSPTAAARKAGADGVEEYVRWDPLARVEMARIPPPAARTTPYSSLVGDDRAFLERFERRLTQNNYAYTYAVRYDGNPESIAGIEQTLYSAAYKALSGSAPRVVAIGVGGGFDILTALRFQATEVTGVEVNGTILRLLTEDYHGYFRPWVDDPRVHLAWDEGRHFLARSDARYDVIQLSGVDSYSGTPGAAHVFSENYLYTQQAVELYLSRLSDRGILHMMRLEHDPPREMLRAVVTAAAALRRSGAEPGDNIVTLTATRGNITSLLVKRTPFTLEERRRLEVWAAQSPHFRVSASADRNGRRENVYEAFLSLHDARLERVFAEQYPFDISPTDDDQPFFFRASRWWHIFPESPVIWGTVPVMEYSLLLLAFAVGLTSIVVVWLPLRWLTRSRHPAGLFRYGLFFALIGVGFMAIEMAFLQRFGLLLGHPSYALSVVLAVLLFASGIGSWCSGAVVARLGGLRFVAYSLCILVLAQVVLLPHPADLVAWPFALRVLLVVVLVGSAGFLMGMFLPTGLDRLKTRSSSFVPWAWGLNGIASVIAPVISVGLAITYGNTRLLVVALPLYLLAGFCLPQAAARPAPRL